eukprot:Colp12_sorted_trinity150504_noHs@1373
MKQSMSQALVLNPLSTENYVLLRDHRMAVAKLKTEYARHVREFARLQQEALQSDNPHLAARAGPPGMGALQMVTRRPEGDFTDYSDTEDLDITESVDGLHDNNDE